MSPVVRFTLAICAGFAAVASAGFAVLYSAIEANNTAYHKAALPVTTAWFAAAAPYGCVPAAVLAFAALHAARRRDDSLLAVATSLAGLFAVTWPLLCVIAWRLPYVLIGTRLD